MQGWHAARATFPPTSGQYSWPTRHDAGRWHVARQVNPPIGGAGGHRYNGIALIPGALAATSRDIILTRPGGRASAHAS